MAMSARRTLRRRIAMIGLCCALCAVAVVMLVLGLGRLKEVQRSDLTLQDLRRRLTGYLHQMDREVTLLTLDIDVDGTSVERLQGWAEEGNEALSDLRDGFGRLLDEQPVYQQMQEEWTELAGADISQGWQRYRVDLSAFSDHLDSTFDGMEQSLAVSRQTAYAFCMAGAFAVGLCLLLCAWIFMTVLSDVASDSYDPDLLEQEVAALAENAQFKARIRLLLPEGEREDTGHDWQLSLTRRLKDQRTHICFEAMARHSNCEVRLWGRRYKWAGYLKSFQRVFFPAFSQATWRAACLMHNAGMGAPVPVVHKRLRVGPFKAGAIVLIEHVGKVESVREFLRSGFCLLSEAQQDVWLQRVADFLDDLHGLDIYGVKPRYLHGQHLRDPDRMRLLLCDLDKVLLWANCPGLVARMCRAKDRARLVKDAESVLSPTRVSQLRSWL